MTLLDKMAEALDDQLKQHWLDKSPVDTRQIAAAVLAPLLTPTQSLVHKMGAQAFAGPQPAGSWTLYPAAMLQAAIKFVTEEEDRGFDDHEGKAGQEEAAPADQD